MEEEGKMNLSPAQQKVIDLMKDGWELGMSQTIGTIGVCKLQQGGIGRGGKTQRVRRDIVYHLERRRLIKRTGEFFPTQVFALTEKGKEL